MRKPYQVLFLLLGVLIFAWPVVALAYEDGDVQAIPGYTLSGRPMHKAAPASKVARLRSSMAAADPDTVWIGHIAESSWIPKQADEVTNVPGVPAGGYGPYHVGRGYMRPGTDGPPFGPGKTTYNGLWDFDHFQATELSTGGDSLMGWWPYAIPYASGQTKTDDKIRPFYGLDYGNMGNYSINEGGPTYAFTPGFPQKRTFGVIGYWHRDRGNGVTAFTDTGAVVPGPNPEWAPLGGNASAWCGLRVHGDNSVSDPLTGNPFNSDVLQLMGNDSWNPGGSLSALGSDENFPGFGSQWDQILYRDVTLGANDNLTISFKAMYALSRTRGGSATQRAGYFWKDPRKNVVANDGNYISATDAEVTNGGPVDSFTVYVGAPVEPVIGPINDYVGADGSGHEIYDTQRRWYDEVIKCTALGGGTAPLVQVLSAAGFSGRAADWDPSQGVPLSVTVGPVVIPNAGALHDAIAAGGGKVRIAFRVKTNRSNDDQDYVISGFTSWTRGAAIVDDVVVNGSTLGDFENTTPGRDIDNTKPATDAWRSTGKPPGIYVHPHTVDPNTPGHAVWNDPCAPPGAAAANCNMVGNVLTGGDHDNGEKPGGNFGAPDQDRAKGVASPVINFKNGGAGVYNAMGIDANVANATDDYQLFFEQHTPGFRGSLNGNYFQYQSQCYPALQRNGAEVWGEMRFPPFIFSWGENACFLVTTGGLRAQGMWVTSRAGGIPDSARVGLNFHTRCFTLNISGANCSPATGSFAGQHIDNMSFCITDGTPPPGLAASPWFLYQDAFPATSTSNFASANFDTCSALVKNTLNRSLLTGFDRPSIPGDSSYVNATSQGATPMRIDMIFRVLPGVGNYVQIGNRASGIRKVPTSTTAAVSNASSSNFWESYMGDNGAFGTGGNGTTGPGHPGGKWDPNTWNSARMDTAEFNLFPAQSVGGNINGLDPTTWMTMYHESDPKYTKLGIAKNRCFVVDVTPGSGFNCASKLPTSVSDCNVVCGVTNPGTPPFDQFPPFIYTSSLSSGLPLSENGLPSGKTYEFTKIIPDGQLTPGALVQYFYRRSPGTSVAVDLMPDTNFVNFGNMADASRWYSFSVLPDRWKDPAFGQGGTGMACMLVNDAGDRRGDEYFWVSLADSLGLTSSGKRGAHNGWYAAGGANSFNTFDQATFRRDNGGQPGSSWDMWDGRAGESSTTGCAWLSNRSATIPGAGELTAGKESKTGPTGNMLRNWYRTLIMLEADLSSVFFGTTANRTDDDLAMMNDYANNATGTSQPRAVYLIGQGFMEAMTQAVRNPPAGGTAWLGSYFGVNYRDGVYRTFSGNAKAVAPYRARTGSAMDAPVTIGSRYIGSGILYGVSDGCGIENDVLAVNTGVTTAVAQMDYENVGASGPYIGAIYAPNTGATRLHTTYYDGTRINRIGTYPGGVDPQLPVGRAGFWYYFAKSLNLVAGAVGCGPQGAPVGVGDNPGAGSGSAFVNFMNLRSANPMRSGEARIAFGLVRTEKVEVKVYDVTGRLVKTVANRVFAGGQEHIVTWDGTDEGGNRVRSGVYFYQLKTPSWTSQKKLAMLSN
jgi:hypothetical protein